MPDLADMQQTLLDSTTKLEEMAAKIKALEEGQTAKLSNQSESDYAPSENLVPHGLCDSAECSTCPMERLGMGAQMQQTFMAQLDAAAEWAGIGRERDHLTAAVQEWLAAGKPPGTREKMIRITS